jgi:hypothetical protein
MSYFGLEDIKTYKATFTVRTMSENNKLYIVHKFSVTECNILRFPPLKWY